MYSERQREQNYNFHFQTIFRWAVLEYLKYIYSQRWGGDVCKGFGIFIINFPRLEFKFSDWRSKAVDSDSPNFLQTFMGERGLQSKEVKI